MSKYKKKQYNLDTIIVGMGLNPFECKQRMLKKGYNMYTTCISLDSPTFKKK